MPIIDQCEHCGAEGPVLPTPHGYHCEQCYPQVMGQEDDHPGADYTLAGPLDECEGLDGQPIQWQPGELGDAPRYE